VFTSRTQLAKERAQGAFFEPEIPVGSILGLLEVCSYLNLIWRKK
jgi:hypothetical protein